MPKSASYQVSWSSERAEYHLISEEQGEQALLVDETERWLQWLAEHDSFAFHGRNGHLTLLKERRSRGGYWYAYRRGEGGMLKHYVGRSERVIMQRLEGIAEQMAGEERAREAIPPHDQPASLLPDGKLQKARQKMDEQAENVLQGREQVAMAPHVEPLLLTKLQLPHFQSSLLPREQLLELFDHALEHKLTLVAGPAGYAKTTAVCQWIASRSGRPDFPGVASVRLDEEDNDPIRFWRYVIAACQQIWPGFGQEALTLLLAHRLPALKPLQMMLTMLLNELSQLDKPGLLILDDAHVITSVPVIETLSFFLDHLPATFHVIMLTRGDPPFSLARWRARNETLDIYPFHLAFSLEETHDFLARELDFELSAQSVRRIHERMEGWPAGLRLFMRALPHARNEQDVENILARFSGSYWGIQDYFFNEVLRALPEDERAFLLQTSVLPRVTASFCDHLLQRMDSAQLLNKLRGADLFLIPLDGTGEWARYHPLFAETMQQEARKVLGEARLRTIAAEASRWYEEQGLLPEALETALYAEQFTRAADLIELFIARGQRDNILGITEPYSLRRWFERLPQEEIERRPDLCLQYALTLLLITIEGENVVEKDERIQHLLQVAEQKWRDANNTEKLAEIFAFRALMARQQGRMLQATTWARQSLAWLPQGDHIWRSLGLTVVGIGELLSGDLQQAHDLLMEASKINELQGNFIYARANRGMLSWVGFERGELRQAAEQFRQIQVEARMQGDRDDIARTLLGLSQITYQWNRLDEAEAAAREALAIGEQMDVEEIKAQATRGLARVEFARGQSEQARQRLTAWLARSQVALSPHSYQLYRELQATLARVQLASGDLGAVERWWAAIERREETLPLLQQQREQVLHARLLLAQGETFAAISNLTRLSMSAQQTGHLLFALEVQVVLALAYARQGAEASAREQVQSLLAAGQREGYLRLFLDEGREMADLLSAMSPHLRAKAYSAYARQILSVFADEGIGPSLEVVPGSQLPAEALSPQEQKVLRLLAAGNSNAEIARTLVVSVNTVRSQLQSIYRKLDVTNRVEASAVARQRNLVQAGDLIRHSSQEQGMNHPYNHT